jgi:putative inorganic carbon (HCO3(-)) transporter
VNDNRKRWLQIFEGVLLILVITPLLLFPNLSETFTLGAVGLLLGLWVLGWLLARLPVLPASPLSPALLLWGFMVIIGVLVTADPELTFPKATGLLLGYAYWRYIVNTLRTRQLINLGIIFFLLVGLGMMFIGTVSADWRLKVPLLSNLLSLLPEQLIRLPGAPSEGTHANELGGTILIFLPLLIVVVTSWQAIRKTPLLIIGLLGMSISASLLLLLTQSRSAWIGGIGGFSVLLVFWFIFLSPSRLRTAARTSVAVVAVIILFLLIRTDWNQVIQFWEAPPRDTAVGTLTTLTFRRQLWSSAYDVIQDTPFTGTGLGTFRRVVPRLYPISASDSNDVAHAHNILVQVAVDTGLPGLVAYISILITLAILCCRVARQGGEDKRLILGLFAGIAGLHFFGMTDTIAPGAKPGLLFWLAVGLIVAIYRYTSSGDNSKNQEIL